MGDLDPKLEQELGHGKYALGAGRMAERKVGDWEIQTPFEGLVNFELIFSILHNTRYLKIK